jgi:hypothetical protein
MLVEFLSWEKLRGKPPALGDYCLAGCVQRLLALPGSPDESKDGRTRAETGDHNGRYASDGRADVKRGFRLFSFRLLLLPAAAPPRDAVDVGKLGAALGVEPRILEDDSRQATEPRPPPNSLMRFTRRHWPAVQGTLAPCRSQIPAPAVPVPVPVKTRPPPGTGADRVRAGTPSGPECPFETGSAFPPG